MLTLPLRRIRVASQPSALARHTRSVVAATRPAFAQRRHSSSRDSSKPNRFKDKHPPATSPPADASPADVAPADAAPAKAASAPADPASADAAAAMPPADSSRSSRPEKRKRRARKPRLPSVPSTGYLSKTSAAVRSFYSLYRPIAVSPGVIHSATDDEFASIFDARPSYGQEEVESTLSRTLEDLANGMSRIALAGEPKQSDHNQSPADSGNNSHADKIAVRLSDSSRSSLFLQLNKMAGQFQPFTPPPPPVPMVDGYDTDAGQDGVALSTFAQAVLQPDHQRDVQQEQPQYRFYRATFTVQETIDVNGDVKIIAHSPTLVEEEAGDVESDADGTPSLRHAGELSAGEEASRDVEYEYVPRTFLGRMALRQSRFDQNRFARFDGTGASRAAENMLAISVVRRRKLRMKKKKYKKLRKRTRNERRRQDRL